MTADAAEPRRPQVIATHLVRSGPDTILRPLLPADEPFCRALVAEARAAQFAPLGLPSDMLAALLDQQYRAQLLGYAQHFPDAEHFIIQHAGAAAGRLIATLVMTTASATVSLDAAPTTGPALHLVDIIVAPSARGRGIGSSVIGALARVAEATGAARITLSVLPSNHGAIRLYRRLGFVAASGGDDVQLRMSKSL